MFCGVSDRALAVQNKQAVLKEYIAGATGKTNIGFIQFQNCGELAQTKGTWAGQIAALFLFSKNLFYKNVEAEINHIMNIHQAVQSRLRTFFICSFVILMKVLNKGR